MGNSEVAVDQQMDDEDLNYFEQYSWKNSLKQFEHFIESVSNFNKLNINDERNVEYFSIYFGDDYMNSLYLQFDPTKKIFKVNFLMEHGNYDSPTDNYIIEVDIQPKENYIYVLKELNNLLKFLSKFKN
jgi:hypothetical protein